MMHYVFKSFFLGLVLIAPFNLLFCQNCRPIPFEKIYVGPCDIQCTPEGIFHVTAEGTKEKVRCMRIDAHGTYIIKFVKECPVCGRCYDDNHAEEGFDCPLWQTEVLPHIWYP